MELEQLSHRQDFGLTDWSRIPAFAIGWPDLFLMLLAPDICSRTACKRSYVELIVQEAALGPQTVLLTLPKKVKVSAHNG